MKINLKQLTLQYFKGALNQTVKFGDRTSISGNNASGKTRIFDAFSWLLFGKNSEDAKDFQIKPLDKDNNVKHRVDVSVSGIINIDGRDTKFTRVYKEKWVKKRGEETPEFNGHETVYFIDDMPYQQKDYNDRIESMLPESLFKQVTNPAFFNSMKWTDRRAILFEMAGGVTDTEVIAANKGLKAFYESLTGKGFELFKRELATKKKLLKESIANIPARIDEVSRAIMPDPDYKKIEEDISIIVSRISEIDILIRSEAEKFNAANRANQILQNQIYEKQRAIDQLKNDDIRTADKVINDLKIRKSKLESGINQVRSEIDGFNNRMLNLKARKAELEKENNSLRADWTSVNESVLKFNEDEFNCPACNRPFEADNIEAKKSELTTRFNNSKIVKLESINSTGKKNAAEIEKINADMAAISLHIGSYSVNATKYQEELNSIIIPERPEAIINPQIKTLRTEIEQLEKSISSIAPADNSKLLIEKRAAGMMLDEAKKSLNIKDENEKRKARRQELIDSEKSLSQQIADLEKQEFQCEAFTKAKIGMIEDEINSMFQIVKFKMFNTLINGGTEETCESLINGVPYQDANAAAKVQSGLDIIRTLSKHYDVYAPIWIDNREGVSEIPEMECQVISLYVDPKYTELKVVTEKELVETI